MLRQRRKRKQQAKWAVVAGVAAGITALAYVTYQVISRRRRAPSPALKRLERLVVNELREDAVLKRRGIEVAAMAPGLIELSGRVSSEEEVHHAAEIVQTVPGVQTVLNRLDVAELETRLQRGRRKLFTTEPALRWYGGGVGMGRRRQGRQTDPARRDDHADMVEQELEPDTAEALEDIVQERATTVTEVVELRGDESERSGRS